MKTVYFFIGLIVGAFAAFLLAPKTGKEARIDLKKYLKNIEKDFQDLTKEKKA